MTTKEIEKKVENIHIKPIYDLDVVTLKNVLSSYENNYEGIEGVFNLVYNIYKLGYLKGYNAKTNEVKKVS